MEAHKAYYVSVTKVKGGYTLQLTARQDKIVHIVKEEGPITGKAIAAKLELTRSALRSDLTVLTMMGLLDARPKVGYYYIGQQGVSPVANEIRQFTVGQVMAQAVAVTADTNLYDTIVTMFTEDVGTVLICDEGHLLGLVSRKDLLRAAIGQNDPKTMPISMIMTPVSKMISCHVEDSVVEAAQRMIDYEVDCLPVVELETENSRRRYKVLGRVSKTTVTKLFLDCGVK